MSVKKLSLHVSTPQNINAKNLNQILSNLTQTVQHDLIELTWKMTQNKSPYKQRKGSRAACKENYM